MLFLLNKVEVEMESSLTVILKVVEVPFEGPRDGAVVRAIASHQCGPGSNPSVDAMCGLSLLLVLSFAPRGFSPGSPVFPSLQNQHFQISIRPGVRSG